MAIISPTTSSENSPRRTLAQSSSFDDLTALMDTALDSISDKPQNNRTYQLGATHQKTADSYKKLFQQRVGL